MSVDDCSWVVLKLMCMVAVTCGLFFGCIETHAHGCCHVDCSFVVLQLMHMAAVTWTVHWLY